MPKKLPRYKVITCKTCGKTIRRFDRNKYPDRHVPAKDILSAIRRHYKRHHPGKFRKAIRKGLKTKRERGIINKKGGDKVGKRRKRRRDKKWGKIGAPKSAKRRRWLARIRRKR